MATTLTDSPDATISFPIVKMSETPDGDVLVYGRATDGTVDSDDQIVDSDWSGKALEEWLKTGGNVRVQHSPQLYPAGKGIEIDVDKDGAHWVKSLIVEETAKNLVRKGVLQAYSVGIARPQLVRDATAPGGRIVGGQIAELSLVDRPANKNCGLTLVKSSSSGTAEVVNKMWGNTTEPIGELVTTDTVEEGVVTATVTFTPKDLANILGKNKSPAKALEPSDDDDANSGSDDIEGSADDSEDMEDAEKAKKGKVPASFAAHQFSDDADSDGIVDEGTPTERKKKPGKKKAAKKAKGPYATEKAEKPTGFDPSVGGGVHRSEIPDEDFAGKNRSYPIVTPGDVQDAASSIGRAGSSNYSSDKLKANIIRIAKRKGKEFVARLPDSWKKELDISKNADSDTVASSPKGAKFCHECGTKAKDGGSKFCHECGAKMVTSEIDKGASPTPVDEAKPKAERMKPVPEHREPDGPQMEAFEDDADMQGEPNEVHEESGTDVPGSDWDSTQPRPQSSGGQSLKSASYEVKRLHDLTCAAYSGKSVNQQYPALRSVADAINVDEWRQKAMEAVSGSDMDYAAATLELAKAADYLKNAEDGELSGAHFDLHKSFTDMYPDVNLTPMDIDPGMYQRPYISAGHQRPSFDQKPDGLPNPMAREIDASQFQHGPITAGHASPSPANSGNNAGTGGNQSAAVYNANAMRNQAANSMKNLHDHISDAYPQLCPLATGNPAPAVGHGATSATKSAKPKKGKKIKKSSPEFLSKAVTTGALVTPDLVKSAMAEVLAERDQAIDTLQKRLAELEQLPNPYESAYRGLGISKSFSPDSGTPEESLSVIEKAAKQRDEALYGYLQSRSVYAPSPAEREEARVAMNQMHNH